MIDNIDRVLIIHRNRLFRECLVAVLSKATNVTTTGMGDTEFAAFTAANSTGRTMVLVDLELPENRAMEFIRRIRQQWVDSRVIVLVSLNSQESLVDCIAAGAHGCVVADASIDELESAMRRVMQGETYCSAEIVQSVFVQFAKLAGESQWRERIKTFELTPREIEILQLISDHLSNKQIAKRLSVSLYTIKNHVHNILEKLQVGSRFEAVDYARTHRWLKDASR